MKLIGQLTTVAMLLTPVVAFMAIFGAVVVDEVKNYMERTTTR